MTTLDSLPPVQAGQVAAMKREADKRMKSDGIEVDETLQTESQQENAPLEEAHQVVMEADHITTPSNVEPIQEAPVALQETNKERNMRVLREKAERTERERDEAIRRLQALEQERLLQSYRQQQSPQSESVYEDIKIAPDDLLEGKHLSPIQKEIKDLKQSLQQQQQQNLAIATGARLRTQFPDFDKVVTKENITLLQELEPEIARTLDASTDLYSTGTSAYKIIKQLGIYVEDTYQADKAKAQQNAAKPRSIATIAPQKGDSPLSHANAFSQGLTPELQKQLRQEMEAARKAM